MRISHVINGKRPITADLALRLGKALHQSPACGINLQGAYDLATAQREVGRELQGRADGGVGRNSLPALSRLRQDQSLAPIRAAKWLAFICLTGQF
jgi:hypothetical protein